ncbi:MAG TPA: discoidin domain-containing protein [Acetivibrio sp.]|uniref:discoidin domain-containing protein n=1 Tax=Acetivibrio sp. TaxID=1872092 RepID=UPI002C6704F1|nr:discoidin domain-containing protein [Acetivibrio sp.]HOM01360.1 discoidin domain-containing protein [Acetivibrio sp.]
MRKRMCILLAVVIVMALSLPLMTLGADDIYPGFRVQGRFLYDKYGEKVILYGVNEMSIWGDIDGDVALPEIRKTGANAVRLVWSITGPARKLDILLYNCRLNNMIPIIEVHEATGEWQKLPMIVDYWVRPDVFEVLKKHQEYLIINIGNEVGAQVSESDFKTGYETAIKRMREAGIHVPLMIDGSDWGKDINILQATGPYLIDADPDKNLLFSVHMWWPYMWGYSDQKVIDEIKESVEMGLPLVVGEFGHQWEEHEMGKIPYKTIMEECYKNEIGYLAWSWGPGNQPQTFLDMTTDGTFDTLRGWGLEVCVTDPYSIKNIAVRPASMLEEPTTEPPVINIPAGSIAQNKPVFASSTEQGLGNTPEKAVDGNIATRWSSEYSDNQYIYVDLEDEYEIERVYIEWETAYARQYKIQVSDDAIAWTDVYTEYNGDGDIDDIYIDAKGRYVRVYCIQRATQYGNSIFELGVYPKGGVPEPTPTGIEILIGDINGDGNINSTDLTLLNRHILRIATLKDLKLAAADTDGNGSVNSTDYSLLKRYILKSILKFPDGDKRIVPIPPAM